MEIEPMKTDTQTDTQTPRHLTLQGLQDVLSLYGPYARILEIRISGPADPNAATCVEVTTLDADDRARTHAHPVAPEINR
jgi:hypothetical protein